jgi:hypothetical protein
MVGVLAMVTLAVWLAMWWTWHRAGPDAIAARQADAQLRMAERWFDHELNRIYGGDYDD